MLFLTIITTINYNVICILCDCWAECKDSFSIFLVFLVSDTFLAQVQNQTLMRENYILCSLLQAFSTAATSLEKVTQLYLQHFCFQNLQERPTWQYPKHANNSQVRSLFLGFRDFFSLSKINIEEVCFMDVTSTYTMTSLSPS